MGVCEGGVTFAARNSNADEKSRICPPMVQRLVAFYLVWRDHSVSRRDVASGPGLEPFAQALR